MDSATAGDWLQLIFSKSATAIERLLLLLRDSATACDRVKLILMDSATAYGWLQLIFKESATAIERQQLLLGDSMAACDRLQLLLGDSVTVFCKLEWISAVPRASLTSCLLGQRLRTLWPCFPTFTVISIAYFFLNNAMQCTYQQQIPFVFIFLKLSRFREKRLKILVLCC